MYVWYVCICLPLSLPKQPNTLSVSFTFNKQNNNKKRAENNDNSPKSRACLNWRGACAFLQSVSTFLSLPRSFLSRVRKPFAAAQSQQLIDRSQRSGAPLSTADCDAEAETVSEAEFVAEVVAEAEAVDENVSKAKAALQWTQSNNNYCKFWQAHSGPKDQSSVI